MASNFEAKTGAALIFNTLVEYILTTDDVEGDPADLIDSSNFGGKINVILQAFFDNLNYLKNEVESFSSVAIANQTQGRSGTNNTAAMSSLRVLDFLRNGAGAGANTSRQGVSTRATQAQVDAGTNISAHLTPDTFNDSAQMQALLPQATATISVATGTITVRTNIVIGNLLFMRVENTGVAFLPTNTVWTLGGGAWRILTGATFNDSTDNIFLGIVNATSNIVFRQVTHNANNTTFIADGGSSTTTLDTNDILSLIAVLN